MANVKISLLPAENDVSNILGFAGYNAAGTCKISGADLINTLPVVSMQQVFTNSIPNVTATDTSKKLDLSLGEIELEATQTGGGNSVATMTSADGGGAVKVQLSLDSAAGSAGAGQGALIASGTALLGSFDFTHVYAIDNDVTLSAGTNTLGGNTSNYLNQPAGINIVGGGPGTDIGQIELTAWKADVAVPVVNCGIKLNGALGDIAFNGDGLGTPAPNDVLTAKNASGEVEWTTPSLGSVTTTYDQAAIIINFAINATPEFFDWGGITTPQATNNSILPINTDCKITRIQMKYIDTTAFLCDAAFVYEVDVSKLNSPTGSSGSARTIYAGGTNVITLNNATDNGTFFLKDSGALNIDLTAGDVLAITGTTTAGSATGGSNEEVICSITFERTYSVT